VTFFRSEKKTEKHHREGEVQKRKGLKKDPGGTGSLKFKKKKVNSLRKEESAEAGGRGTGIGNGA